MQPIEGGDDGVVVDGLFHDQPLRQAILRHIADAVAHRFAVVVQLHRLALDADLAAVRPRHAEQAEAKFGAAGAEQADDRDDLAAT